MQKGYKMNFKLAMINLKIGLYEFNSFNHLKMCSKVSLKGAKTVKSMMCSTKRLSMIFTERD